MCSPTERHDPVVPTSFEERQTLLDAADALLEALGIDPEEIDWDNPPELTAWVGDRLLAFERPDERTVQVDRRDDSED